MTNRFWSAFRQFLDIELYYTFYTAYQMRKEDTTIMQRYIQGMEAVFESSLQCIIQFVYLVRLNQFGRSNISSNIIKISFIFSLWSIISKTITEDKQKLRKEYLQFLMNCLHHYVVIYFEYLKYQVES